MLSHQAAPMQPALRSEANFDKTNLMEVPPTHRFPMLVPLLKVLYEKRSTNKQERGRNDR